MLGDLCPYRSPDVESPVLEALGPGREVMPVVGQYSLLERGILTGGLGREVLDFVSERDYWSHINPHLKKNLVVTCMFLDCNFQTNIYGTFKSHKCRTHSSYSLRDFKPQIVTSTLFPWNLRKIL